MLTSVESRVLSRVDKGEMLEFLTELVRYPSMGGAESPVQRRVAQWMRDVGFEVDLWELNFEELRTHPAYSAEIERDEGIGVVGSFGEGDGGRSLILNGHVDVVPPGDPASWTFSPWDGGLENGRVRGRGALDMKGGLVAGLFAAKAIKDAGVRLKGKILLESVIGEEDGGVGTLAAVDRGYWADGAIIMEPTDLAVCSSQAGALNFRIRVKGRAAHGCVRDEGVSALEKFHLVHHALLALEARRNHNCLDPLFEDLSIPFPISVGRIEGGDWASSVPDWVVVEGRYGVLPGEELRSAEEELEEAVAAVGENDDWLREHPAEVEWWGGRFRPAVIPPDDPVVRELETALEDLGRSNPSLMGVPYGSDMRLLVHEGKTPAVLFGPGDIRRAHATDESVAMDDVEFAAKTLALMALRFCGHIDE